MRDKEIQAWSEGYDDGATDTRAEVQKIVDELGEEAKSDAVRFVLRSISKSLEILTLEATRNEREIEGDEEE